MRYTVDKMFILPDAGSLKAFCDVAVEDVLVIKGVRILMGKRGAFVSMPQEQGKDNKWYDQVVFKTASEYEQFAAAVLDYYKTRVEQEAPPVQPPSKPVVKTWTTGAGQKGVRL